MPPPSDHEQQIYERTIVSSPAIGIDTRLVLDGNSLTTFQRCPRQFNLERRFSSRRHQPQHYLTHLLRRAILALSNGADVSSVSQSVTSAFTSQARSPGYLIAEGLDTYKIVMDFCAVARNFLEYLSRTSILTLHPVRPVVLDLNDRGKIRQILWKFSSYADESGHLHKWKFVDSVPSNNRDEIIRETHQWSVFGDLAASRVPMTVHYVSIGRVDSSDSRRRSPWCRGYKNPNIIGLFKFNKKQGEALDKQWKITYFADNPNSSASSWVDQLLADNTIEHAQHPLTYDVTISEPKEDAIRAFRHDILMEAHRIDTNLTIDDPFFLPMSRGSCDLPYVCPHQIVCYSSAPSLKTMKESGIYETIEREK